MKRKLISLFTVIIFIFNFTFAAYAAGSLTANNVSAKTGDTFTVEVKLNNNPGIIATRIFVDYDTEYLSLQKAENGVVFPTSKALFGKDYSEMPYKMLWDDALGNDITANGNLAVLTFKVKAQDPSGKTLIKITVDKSSTFDQELKEKSIGDAVCTVTFPGVTTDTEKTTKESATKTATTKNEPSTADERTSKVQTTTSATKPQKPPVTSPTTPTATKLQEETLGTAATATQAVTVEEGLPEAKTTVPGDSEAVPDTLPSSVKNETAYETEKTQADVAETNGTQSETQTVPTENGPTEKNFNYLWLLMIIPVAAAIIVLIKKKAGANNVQ